MGSGRFMLMPKTFSLQSISWKMTPVMISLDGAVGTLLDLKEMKTMEFYLTNRNKVGHLFGLIEQNHRHLIKTKVIEKYATDIKGT